MGKVTEIKGDLIKLALEGKFDVIAHGVNCQNRQGAGIALAMKNTFFTDRYRMERDGKGDIKKLGNIDYQYFDIDEGRPCSPLFNRIADRVDSTVCVVNCYTQFNYGTNHADGTNKPLDYSALTLCMKKINYIFAGKTVGLPGLIGCGLAGGDEDIVKKIIKNTLKDCDVVIVYLDGK